MTRTYLYRVILAALISAASLAVPASAQYTNPYTGNTFNNPMSSFLDTVILNNQRMQNLMISQMSARASLQMSLKSGGLKLSPKQKATADRFAKYRGTMFNAKQPVMPARLAKAMIPGDAEKSAQLEKLLRRLAQGLRNPLSATKSPRQRPGAYLGLLHRRQLLLRHRTRCLRARIDRVTSQIP